MFWRFVMLFCGVFACSTSAIFIRSSHTDPLVLTALRLSLAVVLLSPVYFRERRKHPAATLSIKRSLLPAVVLAFHLITWTFGARATAVAQSTLIVNLVPVAMPFFLFWAAKERINRAEVIGTGLALLGLAVLTVRDAASGGGTVWGNSICLVSMLLFAAYLALGRKNRDFPSIWLYVVPLYAQASAVCLLVALPRLHTFDYRSGHEWFMVSGLAVAPTLIGHSLLNKSMLYFRGQIVSLCNVSQFVFAGIMAYFLFSERPSTPYVVASFLVVAGIVAVSLSQRPVTLPKSKL